MTVPTARTVDNARDTGRKWPTTTLAERVLTAKEGVVIELLPGAGIGVAIPLKEPICPGTVVYVVAFVTATGAVAAKALLQAPTDFDVVNKNPQGVGQLAAAGASQAANTLLIAYSPDQPEGTIGGQSSAFLTDI